MNQIENKPLVSIILPVYNAEQFLRDTLDTLVNQTYPNIEIVAVNNSSTDNSLKILEEYDSAYPGTFSIYTIPFEEYSGGTKNFGYSVAKGKYFASCDADDLMQYTAIENFMDVALSGDYDVIKAPCYEIINDNLHLLYRIHGKITYEKFILNSGCAMYCSLIKRDFYFSVPPITKEYNNDDVVYQCVSLVHAKKIGYCFHPVYFYFRRNSSMVNNLHCSSKMINIFNAVEYILSHNSSIKNDYVLFLNFRFLIVNISARFVYADYCIYLLKKFWGLFGENLYIKQQKDFFKKAQLYVSLPNTPIPNLIYINGFDGNNLQEKISYVVERAFYDSCKVVVLDEGNCDVKEFPLIEKAYSEKNFQFVGHFFALKKIYETGGVYLDKCIQLDAPLNYIKYFPCFFSFLDKENYSDKIFGGMPNNEVIGSLLNTYKFDFYRDPFYPLEKRIKNILTAKYGIPLNGKTSIFKYKAVVFAPEVMVFNITDGFSFGSRLHLCSHDFSENAMRPEYCTLPYGTLKSAFFSATSKSNTVSPEARKYKNYFNYYCQLNLWKKFVVLFIMDKSQCKNKVKKYLAPHPFVLKALKLNYRIGKTIYKLFRRK